MSASIAAPTSMPALLPKAHLGIILSAGNRTLEPTFRAFAPGDMGIHVTRMQMGSAGLRSKEDIAADAVRAAELLAEARVDAIDLQGTGIMMERGPDGERALTEEIAKKTGIPCYTATGAVVESLDALGARRIVIVNPGNDGALGREHKFLEAAGVTVLDGIALDCGGGDHTLHVTPEQWCAAVKQLDRGDADAVFLSGSHTRAVEAIALTEEALDKPAVASIQAALWAGVKRLAPRLGPITATPVLGRLFESF